MLKPFDKVLVRSSNLGMRGLWIPALYGCKRKDNRFITSAGYQDECIPYEGNEKLLGTQFDYTEKKERELSIPEIVEEHFWEILGEDTDKAALSWIDDDNNTRGADYIGVTIAEDAFKAGARWQLEQLMKDSVLCGGDGWFINNNRNCRKNGRFHKYYESIITHDKPLPMENGKDYRLIVIKGKENENDND